jgi:hypothetical protein
MEATSTSARVALASRAGVGPVSCRLPAVGRPMRNRTQWREPAVEALQPMAVIAAWLGHASPAFTVATYTHAETAALKEASMPTDQKVGGSNPFARTQVRGAFRHCRIDVFVSLTTALTDPGGAPAPEDLLFGGIRRSRVSDRRTTTRVRERLPRVNWQAVLNPAELRGRLRGQVACAAGSSNSSEIASFGLGLATESGDLLR